MFEYIQQAKTYLLDNQDWIFSGIGVFILGVIGKLLWGLISRKAKKRERSMAADLELMESAAHQPTLSSVESDQSAAFCYKRDTNGNLLVLLVKTSTRLKWTFPKSENSEGQLNRDTAKISARDEAGVMGDIEPEPFEQYKHYKEELKREGQEKLIDIYFLKVHDEVKPNEAHRGQTWFELGEAIQSLAKGRTGKYELEFERVIHRARILLNR